MIGLRNFNTLMKLWVCTLSICFSFLFLSGFSDYYTVYPKKLQKKIDKQIKKTFKTKEFYTVFNDVDSNFQNLDHFNIYNSSDSIIGQCIVQLSNGCKMGGCESYEAFDPTAEYESFYFSTLYNVKGTILNVKVLEYHSEYGYEITARSWLKQFQGLKGGKLKRDYEIDGISGATISVNSMINAINTQQRKLN